MVHLYSAFIQSALQCALHSPIHTHIHTPVAVETMQGTNQLTGGNLGFSVLPKDTLTCRQEKLGWIERYLYDSYPCPWLRTAQLDWWAPGLEPGREREKSPFHWELESGHAVQRVYLK